MPSAAEKLQVSWPLVASSPMVLSVRLSRFLRSSLLMPLSEPSVTATEVTPTMTVLVRSTSEKDSVPVVAVAVSSSETLSAGLSPVPTVMTGASFVPVMVTETMRSIEPP